MSKEYTREQLRQLYIKLPAEIKEMVSADETTENIENICQRNGITDERVGDISDLIRNVLFGVLPPDDFLKTLEREVNLKEEVAGKIAHEIHRFVFYPVKPALEELYKMEIAPSEKPTEKPGVETEQKKPEALPTKDTYREPIE